MKKSDLKVGGYYVVRSYQIGDVVVRVKSLGKFVKYMKKSRWTGKDVPVSKSGYVGPIVCSLPNGRSVRFSRAISFLREVSGFDALEKN